MLARGLASAFRTGGRTTTVDKRVVEKSIAGALVELNGTGPKVAKEMLKALTVRDEAAPIVAGKKGPEPDPDLRDTEDVPLKEDIAAYVAREVLPLRPRCLGRGQPDQDRLRDPLHAAVL